MSELIRDLKMEHIKIIDALERARELGISSESGLTVLMEARDLLLSHMAKEDKVLYPFLHAEARIDRRLSDTLSIFAGEMDGISKMAMEFFDTYGDGGSGLAFAGDFGRLCGTLSTRIRREENILYEEYKSRAKLKQSV